MHPALLLFRAWLSSPVRAASGILGVALLVWSLLPIAAPRVRRVKGEAPWRAIADFRQRANAVWEHDRRRAVAGSVGIGLLVASIWPGEWMR